jgi:hypothetical protein
MTPKEKAKELVYKHFEFVEAWSASNQIENAKQCALITVDELLLLVTYQPTIDYWNEVKQQIKEITI